MTGSPRRAVRPPPPHLFDRTRRHAWRARAYADAGASGYFVPMLGDLRLLERVCAASPIPVNFMTYPGCRTNAEVAATGVARISHGPFPHMALMKQLEASARAAIAG
jgi:2-methylisocitrate lyase-like PEP mutase family enzyme